jgi:hypothetical protein
MAKRRRLVVAATMVVLGAVVGSMLAPRLISKAGFGLAQMTIATEWEGDLVPDEEPPPNITTVLIRIPRRMRESDTVMARAVLQSEPQGTPAADVRLTYEAKLAAPAFEVTPMSESKGMVTAIHRSQLVWKWLLTPKKPGEHIVVLSFNSPVFQHDRVSQRPADSIATDSDLQVPVTVLTSFGLTAYLDAWARLFGALVAVIGTILGYPFLKRYIEEGRFTRSHEIPPDAT